MCEFKVTKLCNYLLNFVNYANDSSTFVVVRVRVNYRQKNLVQTIKPPILFNPYRSVAFNGVHYE